MATSLLKTLGKHGTALLALGRFVPPERKRIVGIAGGALLGIAGLNLIRGITFGVRKRRDESMFGRDNPALQAHTLRRGAHLSGPALQERNKRLFQV